MTELTRPRTSLLTDHYELTMIQATLASGLADRRCVFEAFARRLPQGRRYGVVAGTGRFLEALADFTFGPQEIDFLRGTGVVNEQTLEWLANYRFSGDIWGYAEGECYFPGSPLLVVESTFAEGVILETLALSILNYDSAVATAASRMAASAGDRPCIEMGSRRTHEGAAVAAARAAYIAGFGSTSNLEAGRRHGIPTKGTAAHSFTLLHDSERAAFAAQLDSLGHKTTLLVDTYDVTAAVELAVELAGPELGGVRLDSGDLISQAHEVRAQLDGLGAKDTRIVVTSDLDEFAIAALQAAPSMPMASAPTSSPAPGRQRPGWSTSWCPARGATGSSRAWPRSARTRPRSVGASTRCVAATRPEWPTRSGSASTSPPSTTATTATC